MRIKYHACLWTGSRTKITMKDVTRIIGKI